jgi:hypothetical protein
MPDIADKQREIRAEQMRLLYQHAPRAIPFQVVAATVVNVAV